MVSKFILGTANFSGDYGIAQKKNLELEHVKEILSFAHVNNLNHFDTANSYGDAHKILGNFLNYANNAKVDSKIGNKECETVESILGSVQKSLAELKIEKLSTLYLHDANSLLGSNKSSTKNGIIKVLEMGLADHIGVSVYTLEDLLECKKALPDLSRFQVPENICDRRLSYSEEMLDLSMGNNVINVRSIFLQGLLLLPIEAIPKGLNESSKSINDLDLYSKKEAVTRIDLCIAYAKSISWASKIIVGVESITQLKTIFDSSYKLNNEWEESISVVGELIADPRKWQL
jgi:aryl-alcohol dehydrogenase-like predicted oxidoreductase